MHPNSIWVDASVDGEEEDLFEKKKNHLNSENSQKTKLIKCDANSYSFESNSSSSNLDQIRR